MGVDSYSTFLLQAEPGNLFGIRNTQPFAIKSLSGNFLQLPRSFPSRKLAAPGSGSCRAALRVLKFLLALWELSTLL